MKLFNKIKNLYDKPFKHKFYVFKNLAKSFIPQILLVLIKPIAIFFLRSRIGRDALYKNLPKDELIISHTKEGLYYVINSSDKIIGNKVFRDRKSFDSQHLIASSSLINKKKSILIDAGANIGTIGIVGISKDIFQKCVAFEPDPTNFQLLETNVRINGLSDKFDLRNEALSNKVGSPIQFELSEKNYGDHRLHILKNSETFEYENRKVISVKVNTLNDYLSGTDLNDCFLFADVQGMEGHLLAGATNLIKAKVPIVTSFCPYSLRRSEGLEKFYSSFAEADYSHLYDLRFPKKQIKFSITELKKIAKELGEEGHHTDLVIS